MSAIYPKPDARPSGNLGNFRRALTAWTRCKETLRVRMVHEDFQAFVRPMYLLATLGGRHLLIALPPNRRVVERARNFRGNLAAMIQQQGYEFAGFAPYPSNDELALLSSHQSFAPYVDFIARGRLRKVMASRAAEDARDSARLEAR